MKKLWLFLSVLVLWQCSSLSLATNSHHQTYRVRSLSHADIKFQLNRLYYRPITPSFIHWMPAYEGGLNSWETIARQQQRWDMIYGAGSPNWSWHWFSPYYTNTWYNPHTFGWYPQPNYYISPYTGNLLPRQETPRVRSPRPRTQPRNTPPPRIPRTSPKPRVPKDVYMSPRPTQYRGSYPRVNTQIPRASSGTSGNTLRMPSSVKGRRQQ